MAAPLDMTLTCSSDDEHDEDDEDGDDNEVEFVAAITGVVRPRQRRSRIDPTSQSLDRIMHLVRHSHGVVRFLRQLVHRGALDSLASENQNRGASRESIEHLPVNTYSEIAKAGKVRIMQDGCIDLTLSPERNEKKSCTICLDEFSPESKIKTLPCFHIFHANCITKWLERKAECPICRTPVPK